MRRAISYLIVAAWLIALPGCAAKRLIERGEAAMLADQPIQARRYYRQALMKDPDLRAKPEFVARLSDISSRAACEEGRALGEQGQWEDALAKYAEALRLDKESRPAQAGAARARQEASRVRHAKALKLADEGKLSDAIRELKRALELDPANADAKEALESVTRQSRARTGRGIEQFRQATALQAERRWARAAEAFVSAVKLAPNHLPSRLGLHRARTTIAEARADFTHGTKLLRDKRLDDAIASLERSQEAWPFLAEAADALGQARARRAQAEQLFTRARAGERQSDWPASAEAAAEALAVYPFHREAGPLYERVRGKAADVHTRSGSGLLAAGRDDAAEAELLKAVRHVPDRADARSLLAGLCRRRADWARGRQQWGAALLWRMDAADWARDPADAAAVAAAAERIRRRIAYDVTVSVAPEGDVPRAAADDLAGALAKALARQRPDFMAVADAGGAFAADVRLAALSVRERRTRSERRTHHYTVARVEPNPEVARLRTLIHSTQRELTDLCDRRDEPCPHCHGRGARGPGRPGRRDRGRRRDVCPFCHGTGRRGSVSDWDVRRKQSDLHDLRRKLLGTPATVTYHDPVEWPYTVHYHEKVASLGAGLRLTAAGGRKVAAGAIARTHRDADSTIDGANPGIGLGADGLRLASDGHMRGVVIAAGAAEAARRIVADTIGDRAAAADARASAAEKAGDPAGAFEARVDRVHLLRLVRAKEAAALLALLRAGAKPKP